MVISPFVAWIRKLITIIDAALMQLWKTIVSLKAFLFRIYYLSRQNSIPLDIWLSRTPFIVACEIFGRIFALVDDSFAFVGCRVRAAADSIGCGLGGRFVLVRNDGSSDAVVCAGNSFRCLLGIGLHVSQTLKKMVLNL